MSARMLDADRLSTACDSTDRLSRARERTAGLASEYPFAPHFLSVSGGSLHYLDEGPREAAPLLMLHGNPTWSFYWRHLVRAFRDGARIVAPDHIGCGLSDKPQDWRYTLESHIENLEALVLALNLSRITLVMHDWGGAIGMGLARRHPERIARLVVTNTAAFVSDRLPLRLRLCRTSVLGSFMVRRLNAFSGLAPRMASARPGGLGAQARRGLALPYDSFASRIATWKFVMDIPMNNAHPSFAELSAIDASLAQFAHVPVCIVWGERDWCFSPRFRRVWQERFPEAEVHAIQSAGHFVLEDAPREVEEHLRAFFAAHPV